jgi:TetR/AcrR family transcriptional regulator, tetracycline repressor protein
MLSVALSPEQIVDTARQILAEHGLGALTMRRLADRLDVQPGALYYHVASKQDLLVAVAERILEDSAAEISVSDPARAARDIRAALLPIRDSADVVSFAGAFRPEALAPFGELARMFGDGVEAQWAAQTLIRYVLGFVAEEQNRAELIRAKVLPPDAAGATNEKAFAFGVDTILRGLAQTGA